MTVLQDIEKIDVDQKLHLSADKISDFLSETMRKRKIAEIEESIQSEEKSRKKAKRDIAEKPAEPFSMKYEPLKRLHNYDDDFAKSVIQSVIESLKQDPLMGKLLTAWHLAEQQELNVSELSLVDIFCEKVKKGDCYGQSMKILELVGSCDSSIVTEEWLYQKMALEDSVRYQILHRLDVFVRGQRSTYVFGVSRELAKEKIAQSFPHYKKKGISSELIKLGDFENDIFVGRLSDFIKNDIRSNNPESNQQDCAIQVTLLHTDKPVGHAAIIYYSSTQKRYFFYDPLQARGGLFSTSDYKLFLNGVADKLSGYKNDERLNRFFLTAYHL